MKLDKLPSHLIDLPKHQRFFLSCWDNLTSEDSMDSDRISVVNAITGLLELNDLYNLAQEFNAKEKRFTVGKELCSLLKKDTLLDTPHYKNIKPQLLQLLENTTTQSATHPINANQTLVASLAKELVQLATVHYVADALNELEPLLCSDFSLVDEPQRQYFEKILHITHQLATALIAEGAHLAELSWIHRNVLIGPGTNSFQDRFSKFREALLQQTEEYKVTINLNNREFYGRVNDYGSHITIGDFAIKQGVVAGNCEATVYVHAKSFYKAGNLAHEKLNDIIDLLNHPMGRSEIVISKKYEVELVNASNPKKLSLMNERLVPNPTYIFSSQKFAKYVDSIAAFSDTDSKRKAAILDAFRLSRIGTNSKNLESKFLNYWTALETLTHNTFTDEKGEDLRIASAITPCITIDYINKRITSFLDALGQLKISEVTDKDGVATDLTLLTNVDFFKALQTEYFCDAVLKVLERRPYFQYQFRRFAYFCVYPNKLRENLEHHQIKVKWQIQRIYRARNVIVHSGRKVDHLELLCANLEHYLKISLSSLTDLLSSSTSIESPEECFIRYDHAVSDILKNLKSQGASFDTLYQYLAIHQ